MVVTEVGTYEAKTHFADLLDRVEAGEVITIRRHGRAIAVISPAPGIAERDPRQAIQALKNLRAGVTLRGSIRDLIEEGRA